MVRVIDMIPDQIINNEISHWLTIDSGRVCPDTARDILMLSVVERYGKNGKIGSGFVRGFQLTKGALASSVSHDHHNIVVVGTNTEDMFLAVKELERTQGGFAAALDGKILDSIPLPIGGLMSPDPAGIVMENMNRINESVRQLGCTMASPFMSLSFISLPTVPALGLTDQGLVDVLEHRLVPVVIKIE